MISEPEVEYIDIIEFTDFDEDPKSPYYQHPTRFRTVCRHPVPKGERAGILNRADPVSRQFPRWSCSVKNPWSRDVKEFGLPEGKFIIV